MFAVGIFISPLVIGALWSLRCRTRLDYLIYPQYDQYYRGIHWRQWLHEYWCALCVCVVRPFRQRVLCDDSPQLLHDDVLYLIAIRDYKVYSAMRMINKNLHLMLSRFDAWGAFVQVIDLYNDQPRYNVHHNNVSNYISIKSYMKIAGTEILHGDTVETFGVSHNGIIQYKREKQDYYRFNRLCRMEYYVYDTTVIDGIESVRKRKTSECIFIPASQYDKYKYRIERIWDQSDKLTTKYYRDGWSYDPKEEFTENICRGIVVGISVGVIGYGIWYNTHLIIARIGTYAAEGMRAYTLRCDIRAIGRAIYQFLVELDAKKVQLSCR